MFDGGSQRNNSIDFIKGFLMLLVIMGHWLQGNMNETLIRHFIYFFHMPLFFLISGFLIDYEKMKNRKVIYLFKRYFQLGAPWLITSVIFLIIRNFSHIGDISYKDIIKIFYSPYYHLWYIIAYLAYITILLAYIKLCKKLIIRKQIIVLLIISLIVGFLARLFPEQDGVFKHIVNYILRLQNFPFFIFGIYLSNEKIKVSKYIYCLALMVLSIIVIAFYVNMGFMLNTAGFFIVNFVLSLAIYKLTYEKDIYFPVINSLGGNTLWIYLLHVLALLAATFIMPSEYETNQWYLTSLIFLISLIAAIIFINGIRTPRLAKPSKNLKSTPIGVAIAENPEEKYAKLHRGPLS